MRSVLLFAFIVGLSISTFGQNQFMNMVMDGNLEPAGEDYNDVWGMVIGNKEYAIIGSRQTIWIVDVTDCGNPVLKYSFAPGSNTVWRDFKTSGNYIYGVCDNCTEGLVVIDALCAVGGGSGCVVYQSTAHFRSAHNIYIDGSELYVAGAKHLNHPSPNWTEHLIVLDISTPATPSALLNVNLDTLENGALGTSDNYYIHDLNVSNGIMYGSHGYWEFALWDVSNLPSMSKIISYQTGQYTHSSWNHPSAPYTYVCEEVPDGLPVQVLNVNPTTPSITFSGTFTDPLETVVAGWDLRPHNVFVKGDSLFLSNYHDGVKIYDVTTPVLPTLIGYYDTYPENDGLGYNSSFDGCWGVYPFLPSGCILTSDMSHGLINVRYTTIVPVDWYEFDVEKKDDGQALISWSTQSESNNSHFEVMRSHNGVDFEIIDQVEGGGNSSQLKEYEVIDPLPFGGSNYYKVKQVDFDGRSASTAIKSLHYNLDKGFSVGPNPNNGSTLFLNFSEPMEQELDYEIISVSGQVITKSKLNKLNSNRYQLSFVEPLSQGHYWLRMVAGNGFEEVSSFIVK